MKRLIIYCLLTCYALSVQAQRHTNKSMIDLYFDKYSSQPGYQNITMNEDMIKNSLKIGMWKHPSIARIMSQITTFQNISFHSSEQLNKEILAGIAEQSEKNHLYREYFKWELNGRVSSVIYTRGPDTNITEVINLSIGPKNILNVSCFIGNHIDMKVIRDLAQNK